MNARRWLYQSARWAGDAQAVRRGRIGPRLWNRAIGRIVGRVTARLWK